MVLAGAPDSEGRAPKENPMELTAQLMDQGLSLSEAAKQAARRLNLPKNSVYQQALSQFSEKE